MSDLSAAARLSESSAAASFGGGGDDFAWACALEPLDGAAGGGDDGMLDVELLDALCSSMLGAPPPKAEAGAAQRASHVLRCRIRGCGTSLTAGYSARAKLCETHLHADEVEMPQSGAPGRFCQRCHKLQPLDAFTGTKRTCDAKLAEFNSRRRAQQSAGAAATASRAVVSRALRAADESMPAALETQLRAYLDTFVARTLEVRRMTQAGPAPVLAAADARMLQFCSPPSGDALPRLLADGAALAAYRASLTAEEAAESPAWCAPTVAVAQRAEAHIALLARWASRAAGMAEAAEADSGALVPRGSGAALCDALRPCVEAMNALLAHTQSALALLRLESRGRYLAAATLACELGAALMRRAAEVCHERGAWLAASLLEANGHAAAGAPPLLLPAATDGLTDD